MGYAELQTTSNYSFLRGASYPREIIAAAKFLGLDAIAITDRNSLAGIIKAHDAAHHAGIRLIAGCRLDLTDGNSLLCYPQDRAAYSRLTRLLTLGKRRAKKGECHIGYKDVAAHGEGQIFVALGDIPNDALRVFLRTLRGDFRKQTYLALTRRFLPNENTRLQGLADLASSLGLPTVATNDVLYHIPNRRILQDVLTCIRLGKTIDTLGYDREQSSDRFLKPPEEMSRLFARHPDAVARTCEIIERCRFVLTELAYQYPDEKLFPNLTALEGLERLTWEGAAKRYPQGMSEKVRAQVINELSLIAHMGYAPYFLTVWRIVNFARSKEILCQGRGSAANSAVCYCLGITEINPETSDLLFARFISVDRGEPPDIDVDFEHERREEVIQWIYKTYGREHAALTATVVHYRNRRAVREVGKALGLTEDITAALAGTVWGWSEDGITDARTRSLGLHPGDWRLMLTLKLSHEITGFPRHLSQHPGGFVITHDRLDDLVPVENASMKDRTVIAWDKDDIEVLKMMKVDVLGLGMLGCLRRAFSLLKEHKGQDLTIATVPQEMPVVYDMLCRADSVGVFQVESRAQMNMLPRLKPRTYYDLVIQVAIVRPGPIQGNMVHPYLKRRAGIEKVSYPSAELEDALKKTLGIPLFQEHAMKIAIVGAGFSPGEADQLRRAMATFRNDGKVSEFRQRFIDGMLKNQYERDFAESCFSQIEGFGTYGFPESHAASFAILVYASSWVKCLHPDVFLCAILNAQPLGFYAPAQLVSDARAHGVVVLPADINASRWDCTLEPQHNDTFAVRLGLRLVKGMAEDASAKLVAARHCPYNGLDDVWRRTEIHEHYLEALAEADTCGSIGIDRRQALWTVRALRRPLPLFAAAEKHSDAALMQDSEPVVTLPPLTAGENVVLDYAALSFSLRSHPLRFLRGRLTESGWRPLDSLQYAKDGDIARIAGLVLVRQRPGSAKGIVFITLEDETGQANLVVWPNFFEAHRAVVMAGRMLACVGKVQREGQIVHVVVKELHDTTALLTRVGDAEMEHAEERTENRVSESMPSHPRLRQRTRDFH
jgi:error-prone DNA polymerase